MCSIKDENQKLNWNLSNLPLNKYYLKFKNEQKLLQNLRKRFNYRNKFIIVTEN